MFLSLVVPTFNSAKTLPRWFESVLGQSRPPDEILAIDGGSTDATLDILRAKLRPYDRFLSEPDHGPYDAMNKGIRLARGDVIAILNSDDEWDRDTLGAVESLFASNSQTDIVHGDVRYVYPCGASIRLRPSFGPKRWLGLGLPSVHPATFVKASVYRTVGHYRGEAFPVCADQDFVYRCLRARCALLYSPTVFATMHQGGLSSGTVLTQEIDRLLHGFPFPQRLVALCLRFFIRRDGLYTS